MLRIEFEEMNHIEQFSKEGLDRGLAELSQSGKLALELYLDPDDDQGDDASWTLE